MDGLHVEAPRQGGEPWREVKEDEMGFEVVEEMLDGWLHEVHCAAQEFVEIERDVCGRLSSVREVFKSRDGERNEGYEMRVETELFQFGSSFGRE